jgi:hypothetical protein
MYGKLLVDVRKACDQLYSRKQGRVESVGRVLTSLKIVAIWKRLNSAVRTLVTRRRVMSNCHIRFPGSITHHVGLWPLDPVSELCRSGSGPDHHLLARRLPRLTELPARPGDARNMPRAFK